jgi:3-oxoacyl-[acyl-carrier protein] reductase
MRRFEGRTVLVTGGSRGLGRAIAEAFAAEGAHVGIGYLARQAEAGKVLAVVRAGGGDGTLLRFDVRLPAEVEAAVQALVAARGGLDVLVNNAGVARDGAAALMPAEDFTEVLSVNLAGAFHATRAALRHMLAARRGAIVNVASLAGERASPGQSNYAASKGGLLAYTRTVAAEVARGGVRVNAVVPGLLTAGLAARLDRRVVEVRRQVIPAGRLGEPGEVARAVLFLASDEASYVIGQALAVDGGLGL